MLKTKDYLLDIRNLHVQFETDTGVVKAISGLDLALKKGESLGLVGETGAGKTTTALAIMQLIASSSGRITAGEIFFENENLLKITEAEKRKIRGGKISMIFQDPMTSLNPVMCVQEQIAEMVRLHQNMNKGQAIEKAKEMLSLVGIRPERGVEYPHQSSGGMKQRVVIAIALACSPQLLIADEPTTALDVTIQAQVLKLMKELEQRFNTATLLITHDLGIVAEHCDTVAIMYAGRIVEWAEKYSLYRTPYHPYTQGLFDSVPDLTKDVARLNTISGLPPDPTNLPPGCCFEPRCKYALPECSKKIPMMEEVEPNHFVACPVYYRRIKDEK